MASAVWIALGLGVVALGCSARGQLGEAWTWKKPCGTEERLEADRQACLGEAAGIADPSGSTGVEYAQDLFRECMEKRGWQRMPRSATVVCE
jgi:hypothetical protein